MSESMFLKSTPGLRIKWARKAAKLQVSAIKDDRQRRAVMRLQAAVPVLVADVSALEAERVRLVAAWQRQYQALLADEQRTARNLASAGRCNRELRARITELEAELAALKAGDL